MKIISSLLAVAALTATATAAPFTVSSKDFKDGGTLADKFSFNSFGCTGANTSPEIEWANPPAGTKSFALMVYDPDAPTGSGWWHWVVYNIPATATSIPQGGPLPQGAAENATDFGKPGYGGPCPPPGSGNHHYAFTVFALKVDKLDIPAGSTAAFVGYNVNANALGKAKITGLYGRKK